MAARRSSSMGGRAPANAALRGGALILLTVLVGVGLLSRGFAEEGGPIDSGGTTTTDPTEATDDPDSTVDPDGTETTEPGPGLDARDREEITFLVLNGSGVPGAAGRVRDALNPLGYLPRSPGNTPQRTPDTVIYYIEGWRAEALLIASDLNVDPSIITTMPVVIPHEAELGAATILIVLGEDQLIGVAAGEQ